MLKEYLSTLANMFREILGTTDKINAQSFESEIVSVFTKGHQIGEAIGYEQGKKTEYDAFWDSFSTSFEYTEMFAGRMWNDTTFKPPIGFTIAPKGYCRALFDNCGVTDLAKIVKERQINLDFSQMTQESGVWGNAYITHCPEINLSNATMIANLFYMCKNLHTVDKLIVSDKNTTFQSCFTTCTKLQNITFEGKIAVSIDLSDCSLLSAESAKNIIECLVDLWVVDKPFSQSIKFHEDVWARLEAEIPYGNSETWKDNFVPTLGWNT